MTEVLLIRHGQSANNAQPEHLRIPDPGLTETGRLQARATAAWLTRVKIDQLYCSPFLRSLETMRPIAQAKQLKVRVRVDLCELGGCYSGHEAGNQRGEPGLAKSQLISRYPDWEIDESIAETGWWGRDYETWEQGRTRAMHVSNWLSSELASTGGRHALVIHADFKRLLIDALLRLAPDSPLSNELFDSSLFNTGISILVWQAGEWRLQEFNSVLHLPGKLVT